MRAARRLAYAVAVFATFATAPAVAEEVICGKDWLSFEPLAAEPFSKKPGVNAYMVRKSDILRLSRPVRGRLADQVGYIILQPLEGDARSDGTYRVTRQAYLAIQTCLLNDQ